MSKKSIAILWGVNIALYIVNIILTCIFGATLIPCIIGWLLASILAGLIIFLEFRLIDKQNTIEVIYKELFKQLIKGSEKRMNEEVLKSELLNKDKEQLVELYLQKCYDTNVEIEQLKAENKELKEEIFKWQTQYASAYVNRQNALIAEKVELQQQLKDNTKQICENIINELFKKITFMMNTNQEYLQKAVCWQDIVEIIEKIEKGSAE